MDISLLLNNCVSDAYVKLFNDFGSLFQLPEVVNFPSVSVTLHRKLGEGGAGDVFLAKSVQVGPGPVREYALKKVQCSTAVTLKQALLECEIMSRQLHPCIMPVLDQRIIDTGPREGEGTVYMLMPLFSGGSLWDVVNERFKQRNPFTGKEILAIVTQVTEALALLHHAGYVHRDIKPQNILLQGQSDSEALFQGSADLDAAAFDCAVTDLGSCCDLEALKVDGPGDAGRVASEAEIACSPLYRPPELYNVPHQAQLDGKIDVWALGCVVYFMMMGINPFEKQCQQGASLVLAVHRAKVTWEDPPYRLNPDLKELVHSCLRPSQTDRPTCEELRAWVLQHEEEICCSEFDGTLAGEGM